MLGRNPIFDVPSMDAKNMMVFDDVKSVGANASGEVTLPTALGVPVNKDISYMLCVSYGYETTPPELVLKFPHRDASTGTFLVQVGDDVIVWDAIIDHDRTLNTGIQLIASDYVPVKVVFKRFSIN